MNILVCSYRRPLFLLLAPALCEIAGCGAASGEVSGTVTCRGKTVASGTVIIVGSDLLPYYGNIEDDGTYTIAKVPTGSAKIAVLSPGPQAGNALRPFVTKANFKKKLVPPAFRGDPKKWFPLPEKYGEFDSSGLALTVTGGGNALDIPLD